MSKTTNYTPITVAALQSFAKKMEKETQLKDGCLTKLQLEMTYGEQAELTVIEREADYSEAKVLKKLSVYLYLSRVLFCQKVMATVKKKSLCAYF